MFARSVTKRLVVGAAALTAGFGLVLSVAPTASACAGHAPWGPWNGLGYQRPVAVSGLPFRFHHCAPLADQGFPLVMTAPMAVPAEVTQPEQRPVALLGAEHHARHHARHHAGRHHRHHGRRHHHRGYRHHLYRSARRTAAPALSTTAAPVFTPAVARMVPAHAMGAWHPLAHQMNRHHHPRRHHHRHGGGWGHHRYLPRG
ncbi:hypothetical protein GXW82_37985 [Streptacidiphilus sp. 4-A2]|nr:hypothetical protein [Streptacidiphilus sp. 4-A2]